MKPILLCIFFLSVMPFYGLAKANNYLFDEETYQKLFVESEEFCNADLESGAMGIGLSVPPAYESNRDAFLAAGFAGCLGWIGVHRWYLGTSWQTAVGYCFLGSCLFYVDFWIIIVDCVLKQHGTAAYEKNPKLFMWK